ncbi:MAG: hypothetical protein KAJ06_06975, partial [Gammaproteobacteria bacterium]|nr:hypothetical protein [Gammaproteobacteria bacterium]
MKRWTAAIILSFILSVGCAGISHAYMLGEETKGVNIKFNDEVDLNIRIRLQPRIDLGDLQPNDGGTAFSSESDLYFRRTRLEFKGHLTKKITLVMDIKADKRGKTKQASSDTIKVHHVFVDYKINDKATVRVGEKKLPMTRVAFTSSSKQLFVDRPQVIDSGVKKFIPYEDPMIMLYGKLAMGMGEVKYNLAISDGWVNGDSTLGAATVDKSNLLYVGRLLFSPTGWIEAKQKDAHLGKGQHLALGIDYAVQNNIEYGGGSAFEEDRSVWTIDLSGHLDNITAQFEYAAWKGDSTDPAIATVEPNGWYVQGGYFFPGHDIEPAIRYGVYDHDSN